MCRQCWDDYEIEGSFCDLTDRAVELIGRVFEADEVGGNFHVAIDDWNLEDATLEWIAERLFAELTSSEVRLLAVFGMMSEEERATALAIHEGYIPR